MKRSNTILITLLTFLTSMFIFTNTLNAQLVGTKTIPGDYATIQLAVTDLNTQGVGSGGVTFNVAAGYTEIVTAPIIITATGIAGNVIVFQKSGAGANPLVTRTDAGILATSTLGAQGDAVVIIQGSDYLTFDGIDLATSDQGIEYGYYLRKGSDVNGCKFVTIKNATVTLTKGTSAYVAGIYSSNNDSTSLVSSATGITVTSVDGRNENVILTGNTISNVFAGIVLRGFNHTTTPYDFYDQNFVVGTNGAGNTIQNYAGNAVASAYGVYLIYHNNANVSYNTLNNILGGGSGATSIIYGIFNSTGVLSAFTANNNNINLTTSATTSAIYGINNAGTGNLMIDNNTIAINTTAATSGVIGCIYNSSATASLNVTISNNTIVGTTLSTTGSTYLLYNNSSQLTPGVTNVTGNSISGVINRTGATGSTYCYYNNGSPTGVENIFNNVFDSVTTTGTGTLYGILSTTGTSHTHNIYDNTIRDLTGGTGTVYGIHRTLGSGEIYDNEVYNLVGGGNVYGLSNGSGNNRIFRNIVYNLTSNTTGTTAGSVTGVLVSGSTNTHVYNNFISDLKAPTCAATDAIRGIGITSTSTSSIIGLYYNTLYLNASSTGANFGTSGIFHTNSTTATTAALDMRNNIVVNNSTPIGTGLTVAFRRSAANSALNNYSTLSNNNDFYAGTSGVANLIFYDGTNSDQTLTQFKTRVTPRESASISENPTFVNSTTTPYNLRINTSVPTQIESGAAPVTTPVAITADFDGDLRNATTPDMGADEFAGIGMDLTPPVISYNALLNTGSTSARNLVASISDPSGVPTSGVGLPVLYWAINSGSYTPAQATYVSGNNYSFTFGAGVVLSDTVKYFVVAQDNATIPNVGVFPTGGASGFTTNPPAVATPPTSPFSYIITAVSLAGDYTVGVALFNSITGKNISFERHVKTIQKEVWIANPQSELREESDKPILYGDPKSGEYKTVSVEEITWIPLENGSPYSGPLYAKKVEDPSLNLPDGIEGIYATLTAAIADLNLRGVSADVNFLLTDTLYSTGETFPLIASITNENLPTSTKKVTIKPNTGITSKISGSSASGIFVSYGVDYVNLEGSNSGGTDRSLTIENTNTVANTYVIGIFNNGLNGAKNNSIKNCIVKAGGTTNNTWSIILNALGGGYNNTTIQNNLLLNSRVGLQFVGVTAGITTGGLITKNIFGSDLNLESVGNLGIITQFVDSLAISENTIKNFMIGNNPTGISLSTGTINTIITKNQINGMIYTGTGGYGGKGIAINTGSLTSNITVDNNVIYNITGDGWNSFATDAIVGIRVTGTTGGIKLYYNSVNLFGNADRSATATLSAALYLIGTTGGLDIRNNVFSNSLVNTLNTGAKAYSIYNAGTNTVFTSINHNDYYASGVQGVLGFQTADILTIEAWRTASGQDVNSIAANPIYVSNSDLRPQITSPLIGAGLNIAGFTTDILGVARNVTTPTIGAFEQGIIVPLAGDYYIPKGSNTYGFDNLEDAIVALNTAGASGAVRFLIDDNLNEVGANLLITRNDLTATNNLVIKPATTKTPIITITGCTATAGATQYSGLALSGASYVTFDGSNTDGGTTKDLTIAMNDSVNGRIGVTLFGNTDFIVFKNLNIKYNIINATSMTGRGIYANGQASGVADSLIIENCKIGDNTFAPAYSISITGSSGSSLFASKISIKNNELYGIMRSVYFYYGGLTGTTSEIIGNVINSAYAPTPANVVWGILFNNYAGTINIYNNKLNKLVSAATGTEGIYGFGTLNGAAGVIINIYNNFIGGDFQHNGSGTPSGIDVISFQDNIAQANVYHNTLVLNNMTKTASSRMTGVRWGGTANVTLRNNIIINEKDASVAYALYSAGGTFTSNYNDLYVSSANANIGFSGVARQSFQTWQDSTGQDANSVNVAAPFTAALDFHIPDGTLTPLESAGTPIALVTTDIDGQVRNLSNPDIGADEFAGLLQINGPSNLTAVADTFAVLLNWTDNSTNELGFYIERKDGDTSSVNPFAVIDTVGTDVVSYNDLGRTPNTTYTYRVQAYNLLGVSPYSNVVTATTIIPVELTSFAANVSDKEISVMWSTATELNNRGFELERKLDGTWEKVTFIEGRGTTTEKSDYSYSDKFKYDGFQGTVQYRLKQIDFDGTSTYSKAISVEVDFTPKEYTLYQNYPNPFNPSTTIKFALPFDSNIRITVYNLLGEQVEVIFDQVKEVGYHNVSWNASSLASGVYIYTIDAKSVDGLKNFNSVKKMMLVK